jgi:3-oxoadipate enol-lactonase
MDGEFQCSDGAKLFYKVDDFTDPWKTASTVILVHGVAESTEAWRAWIPYLSRAFRVIRLDVRGFGNSTPMPLEYQWTLEGLVGDLRQFIEHLNCGPVHLVGAKSGGTMTFRLAADAPQLVHTLTGITPAARGKESAIRWADEIKAHGMKVWAENTMRGRLGSQVSRAEFDWWVNNIQGKTPVSTMLGYLRMVPTLDIRSDVERIRCPTLIVATASGGMHSVDSYHEWQPKIKSSHLEIIKGDAWHAAGAYPDECARITSRFILEHCGEGA